MNKGFTLIELLAVIVILAIIALIATPIILNIVEDSKKSAVTESAKLYIDGLQNRIASENMTREFNPSSCTITNGNISCDGQSIDYTVDGQSPTSGSITFNNGLVTGYTLGISGYTVTKNGSTITTTKGEPTIEFNGTYVAGGQNDTYIGIAYLDPTNLSTTCTVQLAAQNLNDEETPTPTGIKSGCMKFYVYKDDGTNYSMILDHNTSGSLHWSNVGDRLIEDTTGWAGSPRLITADEVAHIVGIDEALGWDSTDPNADRFFFDGSGTEYSGWQIYYGYGDVSYRLFHSRYAWLYNNMEYCMCGGCEVEDNNQYPYGTMDSENTSPIYGYFTSTPFANGSAGMWFIDRAGIDNSYYAVETNTAGVRPVITLPKSILE